MSDWDRSGWDAWVAKVKEVDDNPDVDPRTQKLYWFGSNAGFTQAETDALVALLTLIDPLGDRVLPPGCIPVS
jgi:hypothetical protein